MTTEPTSQFAQAIENNHEVAGRVGAGAGVVGGLLGGGVACMLLSSGSLQTANTCIVDGGSTLGVSDIASGGARARTRFANVLPGMCSKLLGRLVATRFSCVICTRLGFAGSSSSGGDARNGHSARPSRQFSRVGAGFVISVPRTRRRFGCGKKGARSVV